MALGQPATQHGDGIFAKWGVADLAPLALALHMRRRTEHNVLAAKAEKFGGAQPSLHGQQQQGPIATPAPAIEIRSSKQGGDLDRREERDWSAKMALAWHSKDALCQRAMFRRVQRNVAEEGMDSGETDIATAGAVIALPFEMIKERTDKRCIEIP
jgi:hypothetical protein